MATAYRLEFATVEDTPVSCLIWDTTTYSEPAPHNYISITGTGSPLILSTIDNDEDKFTPVKALQLEINFLSTNQVNIYSFATGEDNRWFVEVYYINANTQIFKGHLVLDEDAKEQFLCHPNEVNLRATDGIGLLKDIPLTDAAGNNPKGAYSLLQYVVWALAKTGLEININILFNLRNKTGGPAFIETFLDAKTFEAEIGESVSCYDVLEMILGESCYLTQALGEWWIIRVPEHMDDSNEVNKYDHTGVHQALIGQSWTYVIKSPLPDEWFAFFSQESAVVSYIRPHKFIKEVYAYEYPKEIIDNIDFEQGGLFTPVVPIVDLGDLAGEDRDDEGYNYDDFTAKAFHIDGWTAGNNPPTESPATNTSYIKRVYYQGTEYDRYLNIVGNFGTQNNYVKSNQITVDEKARFTFSLEYKFNFDIDFGGTSTDAWCAIKLEGNNGTTYWLHATGNWRTVFERVYRQWKPTDTDDTQWTNLSVTAKPLPASGMLTIYLLQSDIYPDLESVQAGIQIQFRFKDLKFDYEPYVNNSYSKKREQYHKVTQGGNYKAIRDNNVFVSDSPVRLFKGALLRVLNDDYQLTDGWFDHTASPLPEPGDYHSFGWWQAYGVWNQYNRLMRSFEFTAQGLASNAIFPTMVHRYILQDESIHTTFKVFMLLHYSIDVKLCEWEGVLREVRDVNINRDYTTPIEFKYMEDR